MVYIIATLLRKAFHKYDRVIENKASMDDLWKTLMLTPLDYDYSSLYDIKTR